MGKDVKGTITVGSLTGEVEINNTALNQILVNKTYSFVNGVLEFDYDNIHVEASGKIVIIKKVDAIGRIKTGGTNSVGGGRGRFVRCTSPVDGKSSFINIARLYMLAKHLELGHIVLADVDKYYLNHLDNRGDEEGYIDTKEGLNLGNYELCTKDQNDRHGRVWHKIFNLVGTRTKFSAYNEKFMSFIEACETKEDVEMILRYYGIIK